MLRDCRLKPLEFHGDYYAPRVSLTYLDKLLPVPFLNLMVPWIDRVGGAGFVRRITDRLEGRQRSPVALAAWALLFFGVIYPTLRTVYGAS